MYEGQFDNELKFIKDDDLRLWTVDLLNDLPDYFWHVPASSTGKYHPDYALGDGGLVRHTKAAVKIANCLINDSNVFETLSDLDKDVIIIALLLHDGFKHGLEYNKYTIFEHPEIMANHLRDLADKLENEDENNCCKSKIYRDIAFAVHSHMGQWNSSKRSNVTLPLPMQPVNKLVHICDYLASRKFIEINFNE